MLSCANSQPSVVAPILNSLRWLSGMEAKVWAQS